MQHVDRPKTVVLKGEQAVDVLNEYIHELQAGSAEELTREQTEAMIRLAKGLISTIKSETQTQPKAQVPFLPQIKEAIKNSLPPVIEQLRQLDIPSSTNLTKSLHHPPPPHAYIR